MLYDSTSIAHKQHRTNNNTSFHSNNKQEIVEFIDGSLEHGISVLLFSQRGQGRCVLAMCAYLMCKYRWSYDKAFELILTKKPGMSMSVSKIDV